MIDPYSQTWLEVKEHAEKATEAATSAIIARGTDQAETEYHRGRIAALRAVLELGKPREEIQFTSPDM